MKKTKPTPKLPSEKELDRHVAKAMKATRARMRANMLRQIGERLHAVWADDEVAAIVDARERAKAAELPVAGLPAKR